MNMVKSDRLREGIELVSLPDGTGLLLDPFHQRFHNLNASGMLICQCLTAGMESQEIIQHLQFHYPEIGGALEIELDLIEFLSELKNYSILVGSQVHL